MLPPWSSPLVTSELQVHYSRPQPSASSWVHGASGNLTTCLILVCTCICWDVPRTSWVLQFYRRIPYENQGNRISRYILSISRDILLAKRLSPYIQSTNFCRVTQYMSVYLSMKISDKVYPSISWVHACLYLYSWFFVLNERAHTRT